jgi:hypothetical protein
MRRSAGVLLFLCAALAAAAPASAGPRDQPPGPTPQQQAAIDACKAKGFAVNSDDFVQCIKEQTSTGPALTDKQQAAVDACTTKGLTKLTDAFKLCVQQQGSLDGLTAKQQGPSRLVRARA